MFGMMPGSLVDKTNNNLSNIACLHSNITKNIGPEKEYEMDGTHTCDLPPSSGETEVNNVVSTEEKNGVSTEENSSVSEETVESSVPANNLTNDNGSTMEDKSTLNTKETAYKKRNQKTKLWKEQLSKIKRQAKEKQNKVRVLSCKLTRYYFKQGKLNWVKCPIRVKNTTAKGVQKSRKKIITNKNDTKQIVIESGKDNDNKVPENDHKMTEVNKTNILLPIIPNFKADDDIRNKIKQQLELLRTNRKVSSRNNKEEIAENDKMPEIGEDEKTCSENSTNVTSSVEPVTNPNSTSTVKPVKANLSEVLLSNEGELSIVSVVGGYVSDDEMCEESSKTDNNQNVNCYTSSIVRGTSMTDILLQREFSANQDDSLGPHLITPKKTKDITKIKGWKSKQFSVSNSLFKTVVEANSTEELEPKPMENKAVSSVREILTYSSPDDPIPSTSTGFLGSDSVKAVPKPNAHLLPEPDNILKQGEHAKSEKNTKSAFVSDMLDTFLSNHAELKISYEVPKLVAEEAITKPVSEMPVAAQDYLVPDQSKMSSKSKYQKKNMVKPKTLAEKRRMLELDRQNQLLHNMSVNETIYLKKLEYCEKRNKNYVAKDVRNSLINSPIPFSRYCWIMATKCDEEAKQFAVVNGAKIRINGSCGGESLIINETYRKSDNCDNTTNGDVFKSAKGCILNRFSKPSLIGTDQRKSGLKRPVQYKPGPLSKKRKLLKNLQPKENWECHVLKMPKIKLVLYPEQGKRIPVLAEKYLQLCRNENGYISDEWAKFAVSAVRSETKIKTKVEFELPYANRQNKLLVRKRVFKDIPSVCETLAQVQNEKIKFPDVNVEDTIKDVMSDMLECIDNQQLDKIFIREDPDLRDRYKTNAEDNHCRPPSPINPMVKAIIKRPHAKKSKTTLELRRLNVQVIEVDVKEEETDKTNCTNDFCRLGCICKSLRGATGIVPEHCGREQCMLECKCTFGTAQRVHHSITLPAGTDLLSASTVVRLQDEAKRNLAKEERKFTQTVIKANNQTIMVGGGTRDRQRRVPKVPKKYSNYVQKSNKSLSYMEMISNGLLEDEQDPDFTLNRYQMQKTQTTQKVPGENTPGIIVELKKSVPIWTKEEDDKCSVEMAKLCRVRIEKLQLEHVTPWCMVHNLYKCHCGGKAVVESNTSTPVIKPKNEEIQNEVNRTISEDMPVANEYISYASRFTNRYQSEIASSLPVTEVIDRYCARTRAVATNFYQARNNSQSFKARYAKIKEEEDRKGVQFIQTNDLTNNTQVNNLQNYSVYEIKDDDDDISYESELVKPKPRTDITYIDVDEIINSKDETVQLRDSNSETGDKPCHLVTSPSFIDYDRSFVGLLIPSEEWFKRLRKMMKLSENEKNQIRLLEWATLVRRQKNGTIQMWFKNKKYNNILLTEDRRRPSRNHMNIKLFQNTPLDKFKLPDIITSIFSNTVPGKLNKATDTYVILVFDGINWEARGTIVLSATPEMYHTRLANRPTPVSLLTPNLEYKLSSSKTYSLLKPKEKPTESNIQSLVIRSTPTMSVEVVNNQLPPSPPTVLVNKKGIEITKVIVENDSPKPANILAALPPGVKYKRWFALMLEKDFSVLRIAATNFHIKYTHMDTAMQMAKNNKRTVRIRSQGSSAPDGPDSFGIYVLQEHCDKIFFGPYANGTGHGLETFRYVNSKLVNTKIYNKMRGTMPRNTCGQWYVHTSTIHNALYLEPETEDNDSSGSECCMEVTSPENAVRPRIEFVDLTANDSDTEDNTEKGPVDPMFNVLSADFSRKVSSDVTIEPVRAKQNVSTISNINSSKSSDVIIQHLPNRNTVIVETKKSTLPNDTLNRLDRKRKSVGDLSQEPAKKQPTIIDSINLDLDDDEDSIPEPVQKTNGNTRSVNNLRLMPELHPMSKTHTSKRELSANKITSKQQIQAVFYVITNIPGVGYFEIVRHDSKYHIEMNIENKTVPKFLSIKSALTWLEL